jgi:plastocyanin
MIRRGHVIVAAFLALAGAWPASSGITATTTVTITQAGFLPESVAVTSGDTVVWQNFETVSHQVVADDGAFTSPVLGPGQAFSFTFRKSGTYGYADGVWGKYRGTVTVTGSSTATLAATRSTVTYGGRVMLSGAVSSGRAGETVTVLAKPFGRAAFAKVATVKTAAGGTWSYPAKPAIRTGFRARWGDEVSPSAVVRVRPRVTLSLQQGVFSTTATAVRSFAGRSVYLQRRSATGGWVSVQRVVLGASGTEFRAHFPPGRSTLRAVLPQSQAGRGYLAGISRELAVRR